MPYNDKEDKGFDIPSFVMDRSDEDKKPAKPVDLKEEDSVGKHARKNYNREDKKEEKIELEELPHIKETFAEEDDGYEEEPQRLSPFVMILIVLALIMAIIAIVLGLMHFFNNKSNPSNLPVATSAPIATNTPAIEPSASTITVEESEIPSATIAPTPTPITSNTYILKFNMNVRTGPSTDNEKVKNLPSAYGGQEGALLSEGTKVKILETKTNGNALWGRIGDDAWICLNDGTTDFATKE